MNSWELIQNIADIIIRHTPFAERRLNFMYLMASEILSRLENLTDLDYSLSKSGQQVIGNYCPYQIDMSNLRPIKRSEIVDTIIEILNDRSHIPSSIHWGG